MYRTLAALVVIATASTSVAAQQITLRHSLSGASLDALSTLVVRFNDEQKGKAKVVLQDLAGVADKRQLPNLALLNADDTWTFFATRPRFKQIADVLKTGGEKLDAGSFYPQVADTVDDPRGRLQALPLALTLPVLFYNKEAFGKAGLDPANPPKTWFEVQQAAGKLFDAGFKCPLTTSRFAWVHVENVSVQHGEQPLVRSGRGEHFGFNNLVDVKHLALLASWQKSFYFHYFGPGGEGDAKFMSGECAMLTSGSGLQADLKDRHPFEYGVAELPYHEDVYGVKPANLLPDGAALWVLAGKKKDEDKVAARFIAFLMRPEMQRQWVSNTGYLPMTPTAMGSLASAGMPEAIVSEAKLRLAMPRQANDRMYSGFGRERVRAILSEEIEHVWKDVKPAKQALDNAMERANQASVLSLQR
jgi:sn-glycerol 3-phosphate transport system substrate-binding protein